MNEEKKRLLLAPSLGCCDLFKMEQQIRFLDKKADFLHIDIKDGNYVKTFGVGPDFMSYIKDIVHTPMDAHLMVSHPQDFVEACAESGATYISPHTDCIESNAFVTINRIKQLGCKAGIALNPATPLEAIQYYLPLLDKVTIMLVDAGYAGQEVIVQMYDKVRSLVKMREEKQLDFIIEADGSMNKGIYGSLYRAGADCVVLGPPALWNKHPEIKQAWEIMLKEVKEEVG